MALIIILNTILFSTHLFAQSYPTERGATFISGTGSYSNRSGELFVPGRSGSFNSVSGNLSVNRFLVDNFYVGLGLTAMSQNEWNYSANRFGLGPQAGYVFGGADSRILPYVGVGGQYLKVQSDWFRYPEDSWDQGYEVFGSLGLIVLLRDHLGVVFQGSYHSVNLTRPDSSGLTSGNILNFQIGLVGMLYK